MKTNEWKVGRNAAKSRARGVARSANRGYGTHQEVVVRATLDRFKRRRQRDAAQAMLLGLSDECVRDVVAPYVQGLGREALRHG